MGILEMEFKFDKNSYFVFKIILPVIFNFAARIRFCYRYQETYLELHTNEICLLKPFV